MGLFNVLKKLSNEIQNKNRRNPAVETADNSIFDNIKNAIDDIKNRRGEDPAPEKRTEAVEELKKRVLEVQHENEMNPDIATADCSVFNEFNDILEDCKDEDYNPFLNDETEVCDDEMEVCDDEDIVYEEVVPETVTTSRGASDARVLAITNSHGGSLALRAEPDLGAAVNQMRIPDLSRVYVVKYSEHSIHLDGSDSRWALVDFDGQQGWVLENYLNFN